MPAVSILLALGIVTPMGPLIWRLAFRPIADASVLALLILAMALHFVLIGLGLVFFGPEEASVPALTEASFDLGAISIPGQSVVVLLCCATHWKRCTSRWGVSGVYNMSPGNHNGHDERAAVLVEVKDGAWRAVE